MVTDSEENKNRNPNHQIEESGKVTRQVTRINSPAGKEKTAQEERSPKKPKVADVCHINHPPKPYTKTELDAEKDNDDGV